VRRFRLALLVTLTTAGLVSCSVSRSGAPRTSSSSTSSTSSAEETSTTSEEPSSEENEAPPPNDETVTANPADCVDGQCRLLVTGPLSIPLDASRYHYSVLVVVAVAADSLSIQVPFEGGGGTDTTIGVGGSTAFGFQDGPSIWVSLQTVVNGSAVLNLTPGDPL